MVNLLLIFLVLLNFVGIRRLPVPYTFLVHGQCDGYITGIGDF